MRNLRLDHNFQVTFQPDKTIKAFIFQNKNQQIKIHHTEDMLFFLHILKTFIKKNLREPQEKWAYGGKTKEMSLDFLVYYHIIFSKKKIERDKKLSTYFTVSCDDKKLIPLNKDLLETVGSGEDETDTNEDTEDTALHYSCNFSIALSEFTVGYYIEVLSRLRYFA